jgi:site-specific DNA-methyltransferase (adenine-specific)
MTDQFTPALRYLVVATKSASRYFDMDAVREPHQEASRIRKTPRLKRHDDANPRSGWKNTDPERDQNPAGAPPLDWWTVTDEPFTKDTNTPMGIATWHTGDTREVLRTLPDNSVDLVLTSPPFLALRSYLPADHPDKDLEIGSEGTPGAFMDVLLDVTEELARVLAPHGSLVVELGDTYSGNNESGWDRLGARAEQPDQPPNYRKAGTVSTNGRERGRGWPLAKSLCMIPSSYAWALAYGRNPWTGRETDPWRVRNLIAWCRPNPPVGALGDKFRPGTSYLTVACKSGSRYFDLDAVRETLSPRAERELAEGRVTSGKTAKHDDAMVLSSGAGAGVQNPAGAPPLDWWEIPTQSYSGSHYATFPTALCVRPIKAMCPQKVCRVCGEPSRRITSVQPLADSQRALAAHIEERRTAAGLSRADLIPMLLPHYKNAESVTAQVSNWERAKNVPAPRDWELLKDALGVSGGFDPYIYGDRSWTESTVEYEHVSDHPSGWTQDAEGAVYQRLPARKDRIPPQEWSDCGHNDWRNGVVLDPFAGSGTTLEVATGHGRDAIGIDLDPRNLDLARQRIGMFLTEAPV